MDIRELVEEGEKIEALGLREESSDKLETILLRGLVRSSQALFTVIWSGRSEGPRATMKVLRPWYVCKRFSNVVSDYNVGGLCAIYRGSHEPAADQG